MRRCRRFRCFVDVFVVFSYFSRFLPFKLLSYLRLHLCEDEGMAGLALQSECQEVVLDMDVQDDHDAALVLLGDICLYPQIESGDKRQLHQTRCQQNQVPKLKNRKFQKVCTRLTYGYLTFCGWARSYDLRLLTYGYLPCHR
ncbi:hypothetical protein Y032_0021g247 [Ancylostoma ceylanicum]|uniref:Uncharacterized protein n=1 Tax=Ancylostoma ceylanicum TaxID=53326 RepID=A0A016UZU0_9BILA|nr:hypothetical protein Y032_0021g247 [Ancylostoma ceylanicum]